MQFRFGFRAVDQRNPIPRSRQGPVTPRGIVCGASSLATLPQRAPPPVLRTLHEIRPQRAAFYVAANRVEMIVVLDGKRLVGSLIEMTFAPRSADGVANGERESS